MNFRPRPKEEPEINLIPFIDVLLVVLIFLMLSTTYSKFTELQVKLPVADTDAQRDYPKEVIVAVSSDGRYAINKAAGGRAQRGRGGQRADRAAKAGKDTVVIISADASAGAPVGDHGHGSRPPRRPDADHLRHPDVGPGRRALRHGRAAGQRAAQLAAARAAGLVVVAPVIALPRAAGAACAWATAGACCAPGGCRCPWSWSAMSWPAAPARRRW
jgi:biopolymer transport protein ExbD